MKLETTNIFKNLALSKSNNLIILDEKQLKQLQKVILSIADDIITICEENNIVYHLTGGSALGAIRHKGFIPWDDDLDIDVGRKDYDKLIKLIKDKYREKYYIHNPYNLEGFNIPATQIRLKGTKVRGCNDADPSQCGAYIDIAIMENTFNNKFLRGIHGTISLMLGFIVSCRRFARDKRYLLDMVKEDEEISKTFKVKIQIGKIMSFLTLRRWILIYNGWNKICKNYNSKYVTVPTGRKHFFGELYERKDFYESKTAEFEGRKWKVPKEYDKYLKHMYGDYMKIPDRDKVEKHVLLEFDLKGENNNERTN